MRGPTRAEIRTKMEGARARTGRSVRVKGHILRLHHPVQRRRLHFRRSRIRVPRHTCFPTSGFKIRRDGVRSRIAGGIEDKVVAGTTAAAFGRTPRDRTTLYVTTTGGMSNPVNGEVGPGRVLSLDIGKSVSFEYWLGRVLSIANTWL